MAKVKTLHDILDDLSEDIYRNVNAPGPAHDTVRGIIQQYKKKYPEKPQGKPKATKPQSKTTKED